MSDLSARAGTGSGTGWTPWIGVRRGVVAGLAGTAVLCAITVALSFWMPTLLVNWLCRPALSFAFAMVLFALAHRAAGMVGPVCTALATGGTVVAMEVPFLVWLVAPPGLVERYELIVWSARQPLYAAYCLMLVLAPVTLCAYVCHDGVPGADGLGRLLGSRL